MKRAGLEHLIDIASLDSDRVRRLFLLADRLRDDPDSLLAAADLGGIQGVNLFYENSTRTQLGFEFAARRLGILISNLQSRHSSASKGESLTDTFHTLCAMGYRLFNIRHPQVGAPQQLAAVAPAGVHIINAGDGVHAHPTQALADVYTLQRHCGDLRELVVVIAGDLRRSRVARSNIALLNMIGVAEIRLVAPPGMDLQPEPAGEPIRVFADLDRALAGAGAVMMLRIQKERMDAVEIPDDRTYLSQWGLTSERLQLAREDVRVLHPGPVNRGVEITDEVADGGHSLILEQVRLGVLIRMAVMLRMFAPEICDRTLNV